MLIKFNITYIYIYLFANNAKLHSPFLCTAVCHLLICLRTPHTAHIPTQYTRDGINFLAFSPCSTCNIYLCLAHIRQVENNNGGMLTNCRRRLSKIPCGNLTVRCTFHPRVKSMISFLPTIFVFNFKKEKV